MQPADRVHRAAPAHAHAGREGHRADGAAGLTNAKPAGGSTGTAIPPGCSRRGARGLLVFLADAPDDRADRLARAMQAERRRSRHIDDGSEIRAAIAGVTGREARRAIAGPLMRKRRELAKALKRRWMERKEDVRRNLDSPRCARCEAAQAAEAARAETPAIRKREPAATARPEPAREPEPAKPPEPPPPAEGMLF